MTTVESTDDPAGRLGELITQRRTALSAPSPARAGELRMAVGTAPNANALSLATDVRLVKAALLYADRVVLYSPAATILASTEHVGSLDEDEMVEFLRQVAPIVDNPQAIEFCDSFEQLKRRRHRKRQDLTQLIQARRLLRNAVKTLGADAQRISASAGGDELGVAVKAGLLEIDPLVDPSGGGILETYIVKLDALLTHATTYPLFDDEIGEFVRLRGAEGLFEISAGNERRGKQAAIASDLLSRMPALPNASMTDVLSVRRDLEKPLGRFRAIVIGLAKQLESELLDADLDGEIQDIYLSQIAPALDDLADQFASSIYLRELADASADDLKWLFAAGAGLTLGLAGVGHLPALTATSIGAGGIAASTAVKTASAVGRTRSTARRNHLYFLYRANNKLAKRDRRA